MYYSLHYDLYAPPSALGQNTLPLSVMGWNDPTGHFGPLSGQKVGSFQPSSGFARAQILRRALRNL